MIVVGVMLLFWRICPPTVLYWPLKPTPVVLWIVIVIDREVILALLLSRMACSLYQGLLAMIAGVTVTPPFPASAFTVRLRMTARVRPPPVPLTVTDAVPALAAPDAASVRVALVPVVEAGLNVAVTPLGSPVAVNATLLVNPPVRVIVIVLAPLAPRFTIKLAGDAESAKSGAGGALTVRINVVERVSPPPVPLMFTLDIPVAAALDAVSVSELLPPIVEVGLKVAVTPLGSPLALSATLPVNPPVRVIVMALAPLAPRLMVRLDGPADNEKSGVGGALTIRLRLVERVRPPPEPLIVKLNAPVAAALDAVSVSALLPPVAEGGVNVAVTPLGAPSRSK